MNGNIFDFFFYLLTFVLLCLPELIYSTMEKIAVFPGSFDPLSVGHEEIVRRGLKLFDKIIIAVGVHPLRRNFSIRIVVFV